MVNTKKTKPRAQKALEEEEQRCQEAEKRKQEGARVALQKREQGLAAQKALQQQSSSKPKKTNRRVIKSSSLKDRVEYEGKEQEKEQKQEQEEEGNEGNDREEEEREEGEEAQEEERKEEQEEEEQARIWRTRRPNCPNVHRAVDAAAKNVVENESPQNGGAREVTNNRLLPGLRSFMTKLGKKLPGGSTINPKGFEKATANYQTFTFLVKDSDDGYFYHCLACKGFKRQEVDVIVPRLFDDFQVNLQDIVDNIEGHDESDDCENVEDNQIALPTSELNRAVVKQREILRKEQDRQQHQERKIKQKLRKEQEEKNDLERTLRSKPIPKEQVAAFAQRDHAIIQGQERTVNSMRK